jgi:hypothetical protein
MPAVLTKLREMLLERAEEHRKHAEMRESRKTPVDDAVASACRAEATWLENTLAWLDACGEVEADACEKLACVHVRTGQLDETAFATFRLKPGGPVTHELAPVRARLCALCAGWFYATLWNSERKGIL